MAKRFTDTDKWKKPFIRSLKAPYKLLWFYILDDCNHAGIWEVDLSVASLRVGVKLNEEKALQCFGDRVKKISASRWFIPDFIFFQYGELSEKNRLHLSVIQILSKYNLFPIKPLRSPLEGAKDKDKDKEQEKDKEIFGKSENLLTWETIKNNFFNAYQWKEKFCVDKKIQMPALEKKMLEFINDIELKEDYKDLKELKSHFTNLFNKNLNGTHSEIHTGSTKPGTSAARVDRAKNW